MRTFAFSNFQPARIVHQGIIYPTAEHYYQAMKSLERSERRAIAALEKPGQAKRMGRRVRHPDPNWLARRVDVMLDALRHKFAHWEHAAKLLAWEGELVEWNTWHDTFWGKCTCDEHLGQGENMLGQLLEQVRDELRAQAPCPRRTPGHLVRAGR